MVSEKGRLTVELKRLRLESRTEGTVGLNDSNSNKLVNRLVGTIDR